MEQEHTRIETTLDRLGHVAEAGAASQRLPNSWHRWRSDFDRLNDDLRAHFRDENEGLFPRALDLERQLP
jgi:iron-sulfur cluster repair protein YtfE (RIC family)